VDIPHRWLDKVALALEIFFDVSQEKIKKITAKMLMILIFFIYS
jgi:hypothetical protein